MKSKLMVRIAFVAMFSLMTSWAMAQTELVVWHAYRGKEKDAFQKVVDNFNKAQAGKMKVKTLAVPYDAYADKITAAVPRGKGPDIFIFAQDRLGGWVEAGNTVEPVDFFVDDDISNRFVNRTMAAMTYRDTIYGLPFNFKSIAMFYNKDIIKTPPKTTEELVMVAKAHTNAAAGKYGLAYPYSDFFYHSALMNAFDGGVFAPGPEPIINQAANIKSVDLMMKWFKQDGILPAEPSTALITSLFNEGNAAIVFNGPWFLGEIDEELNWGLATLPTVNEAGGNPMKPWMTVEGMYIAAPSEHKDEAWEFLVYATSQEAGTVMALEGGQLPANKTVFSQPKVKDDPVLRTFMMQSKNAEPMPNFAEMSMLWSPVTTAMNTIVKGSASAEAALSKAQVQVKKSVEDLRSN